MSKKLRLFLGFFTYLMTFAVLAFAGGLLWVSHEFSKPGPLAETTVVTIPQGANVGGIADSLSYVHVIDNWMLFKYTTILLGKHRSLQAGEYEFAPHASMKEVMNKIVSGEVVERRFTVREGLTSHEIVQILKDIKELSGDVQAVPAEGVLLPNTYSYQLNEDRNAILAKLEGEMEKVVLPACKILLEAMGNSHFSDRLDHECIGAPAPLKTIKDVLTLASIVEKETGVATERKRVAGVFLNRLRQGIALQTDPTVIYAITNGKHKNDGQGPLGRRLLSKDLEIDSPYNTYKYPGLPPGPIANPGKDSIEAVLQPENHNFIYFVADGTGGHVFAATLDEHNKNVANWRKIRKAKNQ
jgi:UPF0755 protein